MLFIVNAYAERERFQALLDSEITKTRGYENEIFQRDQRLSNRAFPDLTNHQLRTKLGQSLMKQEAIARMMNRSEEQRKIKERRIDEKELYIALKAFINLRGLRLMRVHDSIEEGWESYCRTVPELASETKHVRYAQACDHAARTLARGLLASGCRPPHISGRGLPPQTLFLLGEGLQTTVAKFATRLDYLELQFDDRINLDEEIVMLSELLEQGIASAAHVQGLHIDFTNPISIPFKTIFHDVHENLRYIGFGAWKVDSEDIIRFVLRHRNLKSIRLREVLLNEGSKWMDVLKVLRLHFTLDWVSLRGIGYAGQQIRMPLFVDDEYYDSESDSDGSNISDFESDSERNDSDGGDIGDLSDQETEGTSEGAGSQQDTTSHEAFSTDESDLDNGEPEETASNGTIDDLMMLGHITPTTGSQLQCNCLDFGWDTLRDDQGLNPSKELWKSWQTWVVNRCPEHDGAASLEWQQSSEVLALLEG
jgi:hypothetical protein